MVARFKQVSVVLEKADELLSSFSVRRVIKSNFEMLAIYRYGFDSEYLEVGNLRPGVF